MKHYIVFKNSAGCELDRQDITGKGNSDGDFMTPVMNWICEEDVVLNAGDTITVEEVE